MRVPVQLAWGPSPSKDVVAYRVTWTALNRPARTYLVPASITRLTLMPDLSIKRFYTFSVQAIDQAGNASEAVIIHGAYVDPRLVP